MTINKSDITAVILAGGLGTRLRSAVSDVPKPMAPINGKPFLDLLLYDLSQKGIKKVILSLGYMASTIQDYFGKKIYDIEIIYNIEESPLGTGGAIYSSLKLCNDEGILVLNGDSYIGFDLDQNVKISNKQNNLNVDNRQHKLQTQLSNKYEVHDFKSETKFLQDELLNMDYNNPQLSRNSSRSRSPNKSPRNVSISNKIYNKNTTTQ